MEMTRLKDKNKLCSYDVQSKEIGETKFTKFGGLLAPWKALGAPRPTAAPQIPCPPPPGENLLLVGGVKKSYSFNVYGTDTQIYINRVLVYPWY